MGIQFKRGGGWHLTPELEGRGLAETRHFLYYSLMGEPRSRAYLVWTPAGVKYLENRLRITDEGLRINRIVQLNLFV